MTALQEFQAHEAAMAAAEAGQLNKLDDALQTGHWALAQTILIAMRLHPRREWVEPIMGVFKAYDQLDIYGQPASEETFVVHAGIPFTEVPESLKRFPPERRELWRCRWRVKQAACYALGAIGARFPDAIGPAALEALSRYATDQAEDYPVRAAACMALGQIGCAEAVPALEKAAADEETCTFIEAAKALKRLRK